MSLWEIESAKRNHLDAVIAELAAFRRDTPRGTPGRYNAETVLLDRLNAARIAWNDAYDAADQE